MFNRTAGLLACLILNVTGLLCPTTSIAEVLDGGVQPGHELVVLKPVTPLQADQYAETRQLPPDLVTWVPETPEDITGTNPGTVGSVAPNVGQSMMSAMSFAQTAPEAPASITALAKALKNNVDLIYQYVRNNIEYYPGWGLQKGALGAIIENQGTAFDQAELMVSLLRASGYTASYVKGEIQLTDVQVREWLGISTTDACAVIKVIAMGGVPITGANTTIPTGTCPAGAAGLRGALQVIRIGHVWVKVNIGGTNVVFDPSFKPHTLKSGINLYTAAQYDGNAFYAAATSGAIITANSIQSINRANIRSSLNNYAKNLATYLRKNKPAATLDDVLGGKTIQPYFGGPLRAAQLPHQAPVAVTEWVTDIPATFKTVLTVQYPGINKSYTSDVLYGKRLTITYNSLRQPELRLDGVLQATGTAVLFDAIPANDPKVTFMVDHPYGPVSNAIGPNQTFSQVIEPGVGFTYLISNGWGSTGSGLIEYHRKRVEQFKAAGKADTSEEVLGSNLAVMAATWIAQTNANLYTTGRISNSVGLFHHQVGIAGYNGSSYVDLPGNQVGIVNLAGVKAYEDAAFFSLAGHSSVFESLAVQQVTGVPAVSTVKLIDLAATQNLKIFDAKAANFASAVKPNLVGCASSMNNFQALVNQGNRLILPANCTLQQGIWSGSAYFQILGDNSAIGAIIGGGLNGGFASAKVAAPTFTTRVMNTVRQTAVRAASSLAKTFGDPIDMAKGDFLYSNEDISTGVGSFPYALTFSKLYSSGNRYQDGPLGKGWTHSFDAKASVVSDSFQGMGEDSALDAVPALVEQIVSFSFSYGAAKPLDKLVIVTLGQSWFADWQLNNTIVVKQGLSGEVFTLLPDSSYNPPPGSSARLVKNTDGTYTYDTLHRNQLKFDATGKIATYTDAGGVQVKFTYTGNNLTGISNSLGRSLALTYLGNRVASIKDGTRGVQYAYDAAGNLTTYTNATAHNTVFKYGTPGLMAQVFSPTSPTVPFLTNVYDALGRVDTQTNASGKLYQYYFAGSRSEEVDPLLKSKVTYLDGFGKVLRSIDPVGAITVNTYDGHERLVNTVFPEGNSVQYSYDDIPCDTLKRCTHNIKAETKVAKPGSGLPNLINQYTYEGTYNQVAAHTDPKGQVTRFTYNLGQLATITRPADSAGISGVTTYGYTSFAPLGFPAFILPTSVTEQITATDKVVTTTSYDATNKYTPKTSVVDYGTGLLNLTTTYTYDAYGNLSVVNGPRADVVDTVTTAYDAERRPIQVTDAIGKINKVIYNADGRPVLTAAQLGTQWSVSCQNYHPNGKVKHAWGPDLMAANTACPTATETIPIKGHYYDELDRLYRVIDYLTDLEGGNRYTDTVYNPDNAVQAVKNWDGSAFKDTATYTYTQNGLPKTVKDAEGNLTTYAYDGHDRKVRVSYPDPATPNQSSATDFEQYSYDNNGNVSSMKKRDGRVVSYNYDNLNRLLSATYPSLADNTVFSYDLLGRRTAANKADHAISYAWDHAGRLLSTTAGGRALNYLYDPAGNRTRVTWPGGTFYITTSYDALNRPLAIKENGTVNLVTRYAYDDLSRRVSVTYGNSTATGYAYNASSSLIGLSHDLAGTASDIAWGLAPNRMQDIMSVTWSNDAFQWQGYVNDTASYFANGLNQYTFAGPKAITYDANGNLKEDGTWSYGYDTENRLTSANATGVAASLAYDGTGRLRRTTVDGVVVEKLYDGDDLVAEYDGQGTLLRRYVHGPGTDEPVVGYNGEGTTNKSWLYADHQGSIVAAAGQTGTVSTIHSYGPFGQPDRADGLGFRYTGQQLLPSLGLYYYKARMYSSGLGRFLQPDPTGYADGLNLYAYVGNDPVNLTDPSGMTMRGTRQLAGNMANEFGETGREFIGAAQRNPAIGLTVTVPALAIPGAPQAMAVGAAASGEMPLGVSLKPYGGAGGGHHIPAKGAFVGAANYNAKSALAIPNAELARLGVSHSAVTGAQMTGYRVLAKTGSTLTWDSAAKIETNALIKGGMNETAAKETVNQAIQALKATGVTNPTRIPWGG